MSDTDYTPDQTVSKFTTRDLAKHVQLRPAIYKDLAETQQKGSMVANVLLTELPFKMFAKVAAFLDLFEGNKDFIIERDYRGNPSVYNQPTAQEVADRISVAANAWDLAGEQYDTIIATHGDEPSEWAIAYNVKTYADKMGIPRPWAAFTADGELDI